MLDGLYIIIVNWNLPGDTIECVNSLLAAGAPPGRIVVVDNGSVDDSVAQLQAACGDKIWLMPSPENLGFAGGNNLAIGEVLRRDAEWILLINNDTCVAPDFLLALQAGVTCNPQYSLLAPVVLYYEDPNRIWSLGDQRIGSTLLTRSLLRDQLVPPDLDALIPVDFLNACCILIRRSVFDRIGGFDPNYFMYAEDADFCWRAHQAGFRLGAYPRARIWHKVSRSTGIRHPRARYWRISNQITFYRTYSHGLHKGLLIAFTAVRAARLTLSDVTHGATHLAPVTWRAWLAGWCGVR